MTPDADAPNVQGKPRRVPFVEERDALATQLAVIASPVRLALLDRLVSPAFAPDLETEFGITRQSLKRHLDQLLEAGLLEAQEAKRGIFPAIQYASSATGVFALKEAIAALATPPAASQAPETVPSRMAPQPTSGRGPGLVAVHGRRRGEWFRLDPLRVSTIGRDEANDVALPWDPFASGRHALLSRTAHAWSVRDLNSRNGTFVEFELVPKGTEAPLVPGDILGIGKSIFVLRG